MPHHTAIHRNPLLGEESIQQLAATMVDNLRKRNYEVMVLDPSPNDLFGRYDFRVIHSPATTSVIKEGYGVKRETILVKKGSRWQAPDGLGHSTLVDFNTNTIHRYYLIGPDLATEMRLLLDQESSTSLIIPLVTKALKRESEGIVQNKSKARKWSDLIICLCGDDNAQSVIREIHDQAIESADNKLVDATQRLLKLFEHPLSRLTLPNIFSGLSRMFRTETVAPKNIPGSLNAPNVAGVDIQLADSAKAEAFSSVNKALQHPLEQQWMSHAIYNVAGVGNVSLSRPGGHSIRMSARGEIVSYLFHNRSLSLYVETYNNGAKPPLIPVKIVGHELPVPKTDAQSIITWHKLRACEIAKHLTPKNLVAGQLGEVLMIGQEAEGFYRDAKGNVIPNSSGPYWSKDCL